jgi:hypothetical protein
MKASCSTPFSSTRKTREFTRSAGNGVGLMVGSPFSRGSTRVVPVSLTPQKRR